MQIYLIFFLESHYFLDIQYIMQNNVKKMKNKGAGKKMKKREGNKEKIAQKRG